MEPQARRVKAEPQAALSILSQEALPRKAPGWAALPPCLHPLLTPPLPSNSKVGLGRALSEDFEGFMEPSTFRLYQEGGGGAFHPPSLF